MSDVAFEGVNPAAAPPVDRTPDRGAERLARPYSLGPRDLLLVVLLLGLLAVFLRATVDFARYPEEDAAMLLRYSEHLGEGYGIVWNLGEPPVDGATDFLFMLLTALLYRAGVPLASAAQAIGLAAHALTVVLLFLTARTVFGASRSLAFVAAEFLAFGVGPRYVAAGYGTPLFALLAALAWSVACRLMQEDANARRLAPLLALYGVALGMARPEGVFLIVFMLVAVLVARGPREAPALFARFAVPFVALGLAYFLWRWHYFGYPLPNPFYKKGGGVLHWPDVARAFRDLYRLSGPFLWLLAAGLFVARSRRASLVGAIPVLGFTVIWVLVSDETNYFMRFRYPVLCLVLLAWIPAWHALREGLRPSVRRLASVAVVAVLAVAAAFQPGRYRHLEPRESGLHRAALVLRDYRDRNYTLATTEAGLLPLDSEWRAVDTWGLNDAYIAHHGLISTDYLETRRPEVLMVHTFAAPGVEESPERAARRGLPGWSEMVNVLQGYARTHGYRLAAAFVKNANDAHLYYVRPDFPDADAIASRLSALDYDWDGMKLRNALEDGPE